MKKDRYFMDQAKKYGPMTLEKCFENMTIDPILMKNIERQGVFSKNQKHYLHEMINRIISYAKKGFVNGTQKISCLDISCTYTWGMISYVISECIRILFIVNFSKIIKKKG